MERLTDAEIAELRRLDAEAMAPPWRIDAGEFGDVTSISSTSEASEPQYVFGPLDEPPLFDRDSAALAVAARNALPRLLDEVEQLRRTVEGYRETVKPLQDEGLLT